MLRIASLVLCVCLTSNFVSAQSKPADDSWMPKTPPIEIDFGKLAFVKASSDKKGLTVLTPLYDAETRTRTVQLTKFVLETREREVKDGDQTKTVTYTVQVPVTVEEIQTYTVLIPRSSSKFAVPLSKVRAWDLSGKKMSQQHLLAAITNATKAFVSESHPSFEFEGYDEYFASVLNPETLVIFVEPGVLPPNSGLAQVAAPMPAPESAPAPIAAPAPIPAEPAGK
jgi:hypothetical protein